MKAKRAERILRAMDIAGKVYPFLLCLILAAFVFGVPIIVEWSVKLEAAFTIPTPLYWLLPFANSAVTCVVLSWGGKRIQNWRNFLERQAFLHRYAEYK